jgi:hypothetical protein
MNEIKCLYCAGQNKAGSEICEICGLPLSMSLPMEATTAPPESENVAASATLPAKPGANSLASQPAVLQAAWSQFQQSRAELAREMETQERGTSYTKIYLIIAATLLICAGAIALQSHPEFSRTTPDTTPIVLDQSVGINKDDATPPPPQASSSASLAAAQQAIKEKRFDDAEKLLKAISANDADYQKAKELLRTIEQARKKKK